MQFLNKYLAGITGILFLLLLVILGWVLIRQSLNSKYVFRTSSETVIKEMRALNRLETASFTIEKVIDAGTSGNQFQQLLFGDRILLIAHGQVVAGFDLSKLSENSVTLNGTTLHVTLPPPQILSVSLDSDETRVYDRRQGLLSKGDKDLESEARAHAETIIKQTACQGNILTEASKNARTQLTALFKTFGFMTVILEIPQGKC